MTARTIRVKKSVLVRLSGTSELSYQPPRLPKIPKVTLGPASYGRTRKGKYIVVRFYVVKRRGVWFVRDAEEGCIALGTKENYPDKKEAIETARSYCEKYGAWTTMPF